VIGITQISRGCLCNCGFCIEPYKGKLFSYYQDVVVNDVKSAIGEGCKEIWLTSLDCGCYGFDISTNLPNLLNSISEINEKFFVRVGMSNPLHVKKILDELIESYKNEKIFKFLHLPIQSFSDNVLKLMKRNYETKTVTEIIEKFYKSIPDLTFSTDIIVGFPGEDESDFEMTYEFVGKSKPDIVNISKFGAHKSLKLKQLPSNIVEKRSKELFELVKKVSLEKNHRWIDWEGECLIDKKWKNNTWIGRNLAYKPIVIRSSKNILGKFIRVKIANAKNTYLEGIDLNR
jgi:MiaB/RimO family radical SAM methylthiotransferase